MTLYASSDLALVGDVYEQSAVLPDMTRTAQAWACRSGRAVDSPDVVATEDLTIAGVDYPAGSSLAGLDRRMIRRLLRAGCASGGEAAGGEGEPGGEEEPPPTLTPVVISRAMYGVNSNTAPVTLTFDAPAEPGDIVVAVTHSYVTQNATAVAGLGVPVWDATLIAAAAGQAVFWCEVVEGGTQITITPHTYRGGVTAWILRDVEPTMSEPQSVQALAGPSVLAGPGQVVLGVSSGSINSGLLNGVVPTPSPAEGWVQTVSPGYGRSDQAPAHRIPTEESAHQLSVPSAGIRTTMLVVG